MVPTKPLTVQVLGNSKYQRFKLRMYYYCSSNGTIVLVCVVGSVIGGVGVGGTTSSSSRRCFGREGTVSRQRWDRARV
jgi:uncharacterized protein GlcG (DUF336 family)